MITIFYLNGNPILSVDFKSAAPDLMASTNYDIRALYKKTGARRDDLIRDLQGMLLGVPWIDRRDIHVRPPFPTDQEHFRIDENEHTEATVATKEVLDQLGY